MGRGTVNGLGQGWALTTLAITLVLIAKAISTKAATSDSKGLACTGVIGIVLLNNLTTAEEGADALALGRQSLEYLGFSTTNTIPAAQIDGLLNLIEALKSVFFIKNFGGHREYPGQTAEGKICPGNIGMDLVRAIRTRTDLLAPPNPRA